MGDFKNIEVIKKKLCQHSLRWLSLWIDYFLSFEYLAGKMIGKG